MHSFHALASLHTQVRSEVTTLSLIFFFFHDPAARYVKGGWMWTTGERTCMRKRLLLLRSSVVTIAAAGEKCSRSDGENAAAADRNLELTLLVF